jgi:hypothetical protein
MEENLMGRKAKKNTGYFSTKGIGILRPSGILETPYKLVFWDGTSIPVKVYDITLIED